jgi:HD-like signal output (HDOD) protein
MRFNIWNRTKHRRPSLQDVLGEAPLPSFPTLVLEVLANLRDPEMPVRVIAQQIMTDPSLSIRVLRMANSAAFGAQRTIDDVGHAVVLLGRRPVESLVLSIAIRDALPQNPAPGFQAQRFWRTSARRAAVAQSIADTLHPRTATMSFTAALLQDMAIPLLAHRRMEDYGRVLRHWHHTTEPLADLEESEFGWTHADVAEWLCEKWEIPGTLATAIGAHHLEGASAESVPPAVHLVALIQERSDSVEELVEAARDRYMLAPDKTMSAVTEAFVRADELARMLAA